MSTFCMKCGKELPKDAAFCPHCGTPIHNESPVTTTELTISENPTETVEIYVEESQPVSPKSRKTGLIIGICLVEILLAAVAVWWFFLRPAANDELFDTSLIPVMQGSGEEARYGYVNPQGEIVINPQFHDAYTFHDGLAMVANDKGLFGYVDKKGKVTIPYAYKEASDFSEGLAFVVSEGQPPVCINTSGKKMFTCDNSIDHIFNFSEDLARFLSTDGKYGYINRKGEIVIHAQFEFADDFQEGMAVVKNSEGKCGYINKKGKIVIHYQFERAGRFSEGLAVFSNGNTYGYINTKGAYKINPQYDNAYNFVNGLAIVQSGNQWGIINKKGSYVVNPQFNDAIQLVPRCPITIEQGGKVGFINKKGKIIINPQFEYGFFVAKDFGIVMSDGKWGFINHTGKYICNPQFENIRMQLVNSVNSDYFDAAQIVTKLFKGWDKAHVYNGIANNATSGFFLNQSTNNTSIYNWTSEEVELSDEVGLTYSASFNEPIKSYDYWYSDNPTYDHQQKPVAMQFDLNLGGKAEEHIDMLVKSIIEKLKSIYGFSFNEKNIDDKGDINKLFYNLDTNTGVIVSYEENDDDIHILVILNKEYSEYWKKTIQQIGNRDKAAKDMDETDEEAADEEYGD